jgi:hypothetical protein
MVNSHVEDGVETRLHMHRAIRASVFCRIAGIALVLGLSIVGVSSAQEASSGTPLQSVDYRSSGRQNCEGATVLRVCLLSLEAAVMGGTPPIHVKWYLSNGTRLRGERIQLAIEYGARIYGVCLSARDATGKSVIGGHWEYGINYFSDIYQTERYAYVRARAEISPSCSTIGQPVSFRGDLECGAGTTFYPNGTIIHHCAPPPIVPTWFLGDGTTITGILTVTHSYDRRGIYFARLLGTDSWGRTNYSLSSYPIIILRSAQDQQEQIRTPN